MTAEKNKKARTDNIKNSKEETILDETKRNLLGSLEVALFMHISRDRFGNTLDEALRSFVVPILLFPLILMAVYMYPNDAVAGHSNHIIALLYSLRMAAMWLIFFGTVYLIAKEIDRKQYFYQFMIATNWLAVPATLVFVPVAWMLLSGTHTWDQLYPFMVCLMLYTYAFTAFMAVWVLRVPWELGGFIVFIGMAVNNNTLDVLYWVGDRLAS